MQCDVNLLLFPHSDHQASPWCTVKYNAKAICLVVETEKLRINFIRDFKRLAKIS